MVLPRQDLHALAFGEHPMILSDIGISESQIQTASVDCRLGGPVYRVRSAALPNNETVEQLIERQKWSEFPLDGQHSQVLERGACYIIPLMESLALAPDLYAEFSPKSSTGRCDVFVRVVSDNCAHYDRTNFGYHGPLYLEVVPLSFNVRVGYLLELTQFRVRTRTPQRISREELVEVLHAEHGIMRDREGRPLPLNKLRADENGLYYHVDLDRTVVGFESLSAPSEVLDMTLAGTHEPEDFWRPIERPKNGRLILTPGAFYLLATVERTVIPPEVCGQMLPYEVSSGEFRPHYAGFFDNGFGGKGGTTGVLEVRCRDVPFELTHGKPVCRMDFERTREIPDTLYSGNYRGSGPSLSKHFKGRNVVWKA